MSTKPPDELAKRRRKPGSKPGGRPGSVHGPVSGARAIDETVKASKALTLRMAGANLQQVAEQCGYSHPSGAHQAIMRALRTILPEQTREEGRRMELAKLDRLEMSNWSAALQGDDRAAAVILRCIDTRIRMLGLAAPQQVDLRVREGEPVRVEILEMLSDETMKALEPFQDEMVRLSELRAGVIDVEADEVS